MGHCVELRTPLVDACLLGRVRGLLAQCARFPNKTLLDNSPARALPARSSSTQRPVSRFLLAAELAMETTATPTTLNSRASAKQAAVAYDKRGSVAEVGLPVRHIN